MIHANVCSNLICKLCFGNKEFTNSVNEVLKDYLNDNNLANYTYIFTMISM